MSALLRYFVKELNSAPSESQLELFMMTRHIGAFMKSCPGPATLTLSPLNHDRITDGSDSRAAVAFT